MCAFVFVVFFHFCCISVILPSPDSCSHGRLTCLLSHLKLHASGKAGLSAAFMPEGAFGSCGSETMLVIAGP